jgi:DNA invertase Pin-like site-specific DNA recombinase
MRITRKKARPAIAYLRTSSAANVGADKDSGKRQREAIEAFATRHGCEIIAETPA